MSFYFPVPFLHRQALILTLLLFNSFLLFGQSYIVVAPPKPTEPELRAAHALQFYLAKITDGPVALQTEGLLPLNARIVFVGDNPELGRRGLQTPPGDLAEDHYFLQGRDQVFSIAGGGEMGPEYGVYTFLEMLGCRKYSPRDSLIPLIKNLTFPNVVPTVSGPKFPYRELWYEPAFDNAWARWHKLKTHSQKQAEWGMFVHTFEQLCPAEKFFAAQSHYFAWNGAQRSPGQLCLSEPAVKKIVIAALREKMREKPEALYWSVSQNDNYDYCKCERCAASDERFGSPSGTLLAFVNDVAAAFPDKIISTLAYQYTRKAPTGIFPADNVSVCLCSIECNRGYTVEEGCKDFANDVREWSKITGNLMIWDYVVQFRSYISPFPNWHTLQQNLRFFQKNGVKMIFEQGSGRSRSEFSDMRAYLLAKLMWDPNVDRDSVIDDFGRGYYGLTYPFVKGYLGALHSALVRSGNQLHIYGIPQNESFIDDPLLTDTINYLFDNIFVKLPVGDTLLRNIERKFQETLLPIQFAGLERLKTDLASFVEALMIPEGNVESQLDAFTELCKENGYEVLNESGYTPDKYREDYRDYIRKMRHINAGKAKDITLTPPPSKYYGRGHKEVLIDKLAGEADFRSNWLGFEGTDMEAVIEVEKGTSSHVCLSFLQDQSAWIFYPESVGIEVSADGVSFTTVQTRDFDIVPDPQKTVLHIEADFPAQPVKKVRVKAINIKRCPAWHSCNGNPCWIFIDEITIR